MSEFITEWMPDAHLYKEPIVRCRDCENYTSGDDAYATDDWCAWWGGVCPSGDGFCAWGERRSE